ncbi:MAG TPA: hypothetical protein VF167_00500 [Longimicrobiaceae bacterium]
MSVRLPLLRSLRLLVLLLQLALPSVGVLYDAHLEVEAATSGWHVESQDHDCQTRAHPDHCALCQFLRAPLLLSADVQPAVAPDPTPPVPPAPSASSHSRDLVPTLPRGPPLLS